VIEVLEEFKGSFDRLCLQAGTAAIEAMRAADAEQLCGKRYQRWPARPSLGHDRQRGWLAWRQSSHPAAARDGSVGNVLQCARL
jgi:hypothetical protein